MFVVIYMNVLDDVTVYGKFASIKKANDFMLDEYNKKCDNYLKNDYKIGGVVTDDDRIILKSVIPGTNEDRIEKWYVCEIEKPE